MNSGVHNPILSPVVASITCIVLVEAVLCQSPLLVCAVGLLGGGRSEGFPACWWKAEGLLAQLSRCRVWQEVQEVEWASVELCSNGCRERVDWAQPEVHLVVAHN